MPSTRPGTLGSTDLAYTPEGRAGGPGPGILHPRCGHGVHTFQQGSWVGGRGFRSERAQRLVVNAQWLLGVPVEFTWLTLVILPGFISDGQSPFCSVLTVGKPGGLRPHGQPSAPSIRGFRQHPSGWGRRARCVVSCFGSNTLLSCSHGGFPQSLELSGAERKGGAVAAKVPGPRQQVAVSTKDSVSLRVSWAVRPSLLQIPLPFLLRCLYLMPCSTTQDAWHGSCRL